MSNFGLYKALDAAGINYEKTAVGDRYVYENMKAYNHLIGRILGFLLNSDRSACIRYIRRHGEEEFANRMSVTEQMTMPRKLY